MKEVPALNLTITLKVSTVYIILEVISTNHTQCLCWYFDQRILNVFLLCHMTVCICYATILHSAVFLKEKWISY